MWDEESLEELEQPKRIQEIKVSYEKRRLQALKNKKVNPLDPDEYIDDDELFGQSKYCLSIIRRMSQRIAGTIDKKDAAKIIGIQFSILSPEEIRKGSVAAITSRDTSVSYTHLTLPTKRIV